MKRSILITGATGKLGKVFVKYFLEKGDEVIALSRNYKKLKFLQKTLDLYMDNLKLIDIDLMDKNFNIKLVDKLEKMKLSPTCLVNNARSLKNLELDKSGLSSELSLMNEFKLGVIVPYQLINSLLELKNTSLKKIVNVSSIYGMVAPNKNLYNTTTLETPIQYGLSKAALIHLTKELAVRLSNENIQVNCVAYGGVRGRVDENFEKKYSMLCPSGRMLCEDDLPSPLDLLLSDNSHGINGHVLVVDGGWTIW